MKNKLFRQLSALALSLAFILLLSACVPDIHIHTGGGNQDAATTQSSESLLTSNQDDVANSSDKKEDTQTSIASSTTQESNKNTENTPSKETNTSSKETITPSKAPSKNTNSSSDTSSKKPSTTTSQISSSKAKSIALKDAGLKENEVYDLEIELDRDKGVLHFDVSFEKDGKDYDYEINAKTGKIISVEKPNATTNKSQISKSKAKEIALNHAGVKSADISRYQIELEKHDGVWKYEISFNVGYTEYDYTINAESGKILESEKDIDD